MNEEKKEEEKKPGSLPSKFSLIVRVAVALYLLYTVYSLRGVTKEYSGGELVFFLIVMVLFTVIAVFLCITSGKALMTGKYVGGALDHTEGTEEVRGAEELPETKEIQEAAEAQETEEPAEAGETEPEKAGEDSKE